MMDRRPLGITAIALLFMTEPHAGSYFFADETNGVNIVAHPTVYTGGGGALTVRVCIDPASPNATDMELSIQNNINVFNQMAPTHDNLQFGNENNIPSGTIDFESVSLHEIGHCLGLSHPNAASESGLPSPDNDSTKSTDGANNVYDIDPGSDGIHGSSDDIRGDDVNLHWFRKSNNDPFTIANTIDASTYSRELTDLPTNHNFAANGDRDVAAEMGYGLRTEAVMQQGTYVDEAQRRLGHDDVATLRFAQSGIDQTSSTSDDYTITLEYGGISNANDCDISISITSTSALAFCSASGDYVDQSFPPWQRNTDHIGLIDTRIEMGSGFNWFFNDVPQNQAPSFPVIGDQMMTESGSSNINIVATDPENDTITFSSTGLPPFASLIDAGGGNATLSITPSTGDAGIYPISIIANDDGLPNVSSQEDFDIVITNNTNAPTFSTIGDQQLTEGDTLDIVITGNDIEGHQISYTATGENSFISLTDNGDGTALLSIQPVIGDAGNYDVTVVVSDDGVPSLQQQQAITIDVFILDTDDDGIGDYDEINLTFTDPLSPDSDGDLLDDGLEVSNGSDPNDPMSWPALADGDLAPLGAPDGLINAADLAIGTQIVKGMITPAALEYAHGDLYPPGSPDGVIDTSDLLLLKQLVLP